MLARMGMGSNNSAFKNKGFTPVLCLLFCMERRCSPSRVPSSCHAIFFPLPPRFYYCNFNAHALCPTSVRTEGGTGEKTSERMHPHISPSTHLRRKGEEREKKGVNADTPLWNVIRPKRTCDNYTLLDLHGKDRAGASSNGAQQE